MDIKTFGLYLLAVYGLAYTIARLDGPFDVFTLLRGWIDPNQRTWIGRGLNCPICLSFWLGLIIGILIGASWLDWLAMIGGTVTLNRWVMR